MIPLNTHTHYSLLSGYCKPSTLTDIASKYEYKGLAVTDLDSLSGAVNFLSASEKTGIKPIIGSKFKLQPSMGYITLIAKNLAGWKELVSLFAYSNASDNFSISKTHIQHLINNCICISGGYDSSVFSSVIQKQSVFTVPNPAQSLSFYLRDDYEQCIREHLQELKDIFGEDFYAGIQLCDNVPIDNIISAVVESEAQKLGIKCVALNNTYCHTDDELEELRILLCVKEKTKIASMSSYIYDDVNAHLFRFFKNTRFGLYDKEYYEKIYKQEYISNTHEIYDKVQNFTLLKNPEIPKFDCPNGMSEKEYLLELCRTGWKRIYAKIDKTRTQEYVDRIKYELEVIDRVGIEGYFLVVQDYVNWARKSMLIGPGRGSAAGCLTSFLLGITNIDPIPYNLMFERFYNEGRNSPGKISLPDIDVDFPVAGREAVINYIREKYGSDKVSQIFTLQEIQGRSAIREVLRVYGACPNEYINEISKKLPQKASITDKLEEQKEKSIIRWTLNNDPETLKDWCKLDENDNLVGEYAQYFEKAIKIEGTFKSYGKHASAIVIANEPISSICPMIKDKSSNELLAAIEYEELESMGLPKVDILGLLSLDKLSAINQLLRDGKITNIVKEEEDEE